MQVACASPKGYQPDPAVLEFAAGMEGFELYEDPKEAVKGADVVVTDTWASMGQEEEKAVRAKAFQGYQVNHDLMALAAPGAIVLHCLPAYRGQEITDETFEEHAAEILRRRRTGSMSRKPSWCGS